ncbi:hypothetical protein DFH09DRAFT_1081063 [Mycena vulgaris]|nr:hypothetical protein DFH09DRAFT_1081063 [Mycena vulgaris]
MGLGLVFPIAVLVVILIAVLVIPFIIFFPIAGEKSAGFAGEEPTKVASGEAGGVSSISSSSSRKISVAVEVLFFRAVGLNSKGSARPGTGVGPDAVKAGATSEGRC